MCVDGTKTSEFLFRLNIIIYPDTLSLGMCYQPESTNCRRAQEARLEHPGAQEAED